MSEQDPMRLWARLMERDVDRIDLAEGALLIACTEYPKLDIPAQIHHLDRLAARVHAAPDLPPLANVQALNELLFVEENFAGNEEEYDDPDNSYLNRVLERKKGIPITLSLVYLEVARRRGLPVLGVGFPGHFLVKYLTPPSEIVIDPYHQGTVLSREDCMERLQSHFGKDTPWKPEYLAASTHKQILARMLNNLKGSYFRRQNYSRVLTLIEMALVIDGGSADEIRDRGMVYYLMKRYDNALADFKMYLRRAPQRDPQVQEVLKVLHSIRGMMN